VSSSRLNPPESRKLEERESEWIIAKYGLAEDTEFQPEAATRNAEHYIVTSPGRPQLFLKFYRPGLIVPTFQGTGGIYHVENVARARGVNTLDRVSVEGLPTAVFGAENEPYRVSEITKYVPSASKASLDEARSEHFAYGVGRTIARIAQTVDAIGPLETAQFNNAGWWRWKCQQVGASAPVIKMAGLYERLATALPPFADWDPDVHSPEHSKGARVEFIGLSMRNLLNPEVGSSTGADEPYVTGWTSTTLRVDREPIWTFLQNVFTDQSTTSLELPPDEARLFARRVEHGYISTMWSWRPAPMLKAPDIPKVKKALLAARQTLNEGNGEAAVKKLTRISSLPAIADVLASRDRILSTHRPLRPHTLDP
jgi:hypothetical protein